MRIRIDVRRLASSLRREIKRLEREQSRASAVVSYDTDYAVLVHEDLTPKNWQRAGSGPKYLEGPARKVFSDGSLLREVHGAMQRGESLPKALLQGARLVQYESLKVCPIDTQELYDSCKARMDDATGFNSVLD